MAFLGKKKLPDDVLERTRRQLIDLFAQQKTRRDTAEIIDGLLTETEVLMLAKRLVLIIMLYNKCSYYEIHETLGVSTDTAARWERARVSGELAAIGKSLKHKKTRDQLLDTIEVVLRNGMPPIAGHHRYSRTFKLIAEVKQRKRW